MITFLFALVAVLAALGPVDCYQVVLQQLGRVTDAKNVQAKVVSLMEQRGRNAETRSSAATSQRMPEGVVRVVL